MPMRRTSSAVLIALALALPAAANAQTVRTYYIAADEIDWDYAPTGKNQITNAPFDEVAQIWTLSGPGTIGTKYRKALYREYTDATFATLKPRDDRWTHLGFMGPLIRAEVGDTIRVVFKNNGSRPYTVHPHGVIYDKNSEGARYNDGTSGADTTDDGVAPGRTYTYVWPVTERAGPSEMEGSSALWMYHSHANESRDINSGLMGPLIVTRRGYARADGSPKDVDREFVVTFAETDENLAWFIDHNIQRFTGNPASVRKSGPISFVDPFGITNLKESVNGFIYGNGPMLQMNVGDHVRWYIMSTTNFEVHAPHWHGNIVTSQHMKTDVINIGTMGMIVADMTADNPGIWLFHCHIDPHNVAGMQTRFQVLPRAQASAVR